MFGLSGTPPDSWYSEDGGASWVSDPGEWRRGYTLSFSSVPSLRNGGESAPYDPPSYRGKLLQNVPSGTIKKVCIFGETAGTQAQIAGRTSASNVADSFVTTLNVATAGAWNCATLDVPWGFANLFLYKKSGDAAIGTDQTSPWDSFYSTNSGSTWTSDPGRRGFGVTIE